MTPFRDLAIKTKLQRVIALTTVLALGLACSSIITYQWFNYRRTAVQGLKERADFIAISSTAPLVFRNSADAREQLGALRATPAVIGAWLYTPDSQLLAEYRAGTGDAVPVPFTIDETRSWFDGNQLMLTRPVRLRGEIVGQLGLRADMHDERQYLLYSIAIVLGCMVAAACVSLAWAGRLQRLILNPIVDLAGVAGRVAKERDFRVRAVKQSDDEVGTLTEAFNDMLEQIENRDRQLREANEQLDLTAQQLRGSEERFRQLTENIREVFWLTDADHLQMLYISPAFETVWGRSCASLVRDPSTWLDAVHVEDRERVRHAVPKMAEGLYDESYRVIQPAGTVRWVRDRAFPIRDAEGRIYRIAGIAEDITERRQAENTLRLQAGITGSMDEGVVLTRAHDARILYANPKFERMFGYEPGELTGQPVEIVNAGSAEEAKRVADEIITSLNKTGTWTGELQNRKKDGTDFWCSANVSTFEHTDLGHVWISVHTDITARKQATDQLQAAEAKYRLLVERVPAVTYTSEPGAEGRWLFVSPQIEQLLGFTAAEWLENPRLWLRQIHMSDRARALVSEEQSRMSGRYTCEYRMLARDGREVWVLDEGVLVHSETGTPLIHGVLQDVTVRKLAAEALRESEERYRDLVELAPDAIGVAVEGRIAFINAAGVSLLRATSANSLLGRGISEFIHPQSLGETLTRVRGVLDTGIPVRLQEEHMRRQDGTDFFAEVTASRIMFRNKQAVQVILRDITQRKEAEAALRTMRERLQNIYDSSQDAIVYAGLDGRLIDFNKVYERMTGYSATELHEMTYQQVTPPEFLEMERRTVERILQTGVGEQYEKEYRRKDGTRVPVALNVFPVRGPDRTTMAMAAIVRDVTEQRRLQQQILEVSDREQRRIGHDLHDGLCQLLTAISFAVKALEERLNAAGMPAGGTAHEIVELLQKANGEARNVARGLHPVGVEDGGLWMALQELVDNVGSLYSIECELHCEPEFAMPDHAKAIHVYRIVQEAVNNALKHGHPNRVVISLTRNGGMVTLQVMDNGSGLPEQPGPNTGMGMNIMAYRARMIGGTLHVQRAGSGGTEVHLVFPA